MKNYSTNCSATSCCWTNWPTNSTSCFPQAQRSPFSTGHADHPRRPLAEPRYVHPTLTSSQSIPAKLGPTDGLYL